MPNIWKNHTLKFRKNVQIEKKARNVFTFFINKLFSPVLDAFCECTHDEVEDLK